MSYISLQRNQGFQHFFWEAEDVNQDKHIGVKEFDLLLKNLEFRETLQLFGHSADGGARDGLKGGGFQGGV